MADPKKCRGVSCPNKRNGLWRNEDDHCLLPNYSTRRLNHNYASPGDLQLTWHYAKMRAHFTLSGATSILFSLASRFINSSEKPFRFERLDLWQDVAVIMHERSGAVLRTGEFTRALTDVADMVTVSSQRIIDTSPPERPRPSSAWP